jgi:hypothetical protein
MTSRLALHMVDALPLRSVWVGRPSPRRNPRLLPWWLRALGLFTGLSIGGAVVVIATAKILRIGL